MKTKITYQKLSISKERVKWQGKLDSLNRELDEAYDRAYNVKRKSWQAIQDHIQKSSKNEIKMQNYIDGLTAKNKRASSEMSTVLNQKRKMRSLWWTF